ncbi:glyoxalase/bleomycin resistance/extradiol dioxygenase family protein [Streptomyces sp. SID6041]|nr:glyoxalase/bleomycin resistance/extradiol dioxygenase family protein [Streptomyces sp. SID6041]
MICTSRMDQTRSFYGRLFGLTVAHTTPWYAELTRAGETQPALALLDHTHPALPDAFHTPLRAVRITLDVEDRPEVWERLAAEGAVPADGLRHGSLVDPNGVRIDLQAA